MPRSIRDVRPGRRVCDAARFRPTPSVIGHQKRDGTPNRRRLIGAGMPAVIRSMYAGTRGTSGSPRISPGWGTMLVTNEQRVERILRKHDPRAGHKYACSPFTARASSKHNLARGVKHVGVVSDSDRLASTIPPPPLCASKVSRWSGPCHCEHSVTLGRLNPSSAATREASGISARHEDASRCNARRRWPSCLPQSLRPVLA